MRRCPDVPCEGFDLSEEGMEWSSGGLCGDVVPVADLVDLDRFLEALELDGAAVVEGEGELLGGGELADDR